MNSKHPLLSLFLGFVCLLWLTPVATSQADTWQSNVVITTLSTHKNHKTRSSAAKALGDMGLTTKPVVYALVRALIKDKHSMVRKHASAAILKLKVNPRSLARAVFHVRGVGEQRMRIYGHFPAHDYSWSKEIDRLREISNVAIPLLVQALKHKEWQTRAFAAKGLASLSEVGLRETNLLSNLSSSNLLNYKESQRKTPKLKAVVAKRLVVMQRILKSVTPTLLTIAEKDKNPYARYYAISALSKVKTKTKSMVLVCSKALGQEKNWNIRVLLVNILGTTGDAGIPPLTKALQDKHWKVRKQAVLALGWLGEKSIPSIKQALKDKHPQVQYFAISALRNVAISRTIRRGKTVVPALMKTLQSKHKNVRWKSAKSLGEMGFVAKPASALLLQTAQKDKERNVQIECMRALGKIGWTEKPVIAGLVKLALQGTHVEIQKEAINTLQKIGFRATLATIYVAQTMKGRKMKRFAIQALGRMKDLAILPVLKKLLAQSKHWEIRNEIALALGNMCNVPKAVTAVLNTLVDDKNPHVQKNAKQAIVKVNKCHKAWLRLLLRHRRQP